MTPRDIWLRGFAASGLYFGFKITHFAVPIANAVGVIAALIYSLIFLGGVITHLKAGRRSYNLAWDFLPQITSKFASGCQ